ncbi:unnamed protein product [Rotaria socialis]|uniref:Uncharacterized protein n=1 Tax=Rotaria socialis TaxID=392032 RepID=A0A819W630_9BILA|nr:unnamed protein product [Rotaria socialis]CAF4260442.1 unnamed protein product [Rotaria socialis]CAF4426061.1 unnamed protein product [Rotaria socialis]CAF4550049.1 unnamed protein product [Rotaria socialis]
MLSHMLTYHQREREKVYNPMEQTIEQLVQLIDDIDTNVYIIKQELSADNPKDLALDELAANHLYTLEESPHTKCVSYRLNHAIRPLNKLPSIERHCTVYRGVRVRSCDLSDEYNEDGTGGVRIVFKIDCYSSKRIPWSDDDEAVLMPGFYFQVVGKLRSSDDLNTVYIREKHHPPLK